MNLAPIVLFLYNRPRITQRTLAALSENELAKESRLYIFCDGPKKGVKPEELARIQEVREIARSQRKFAKLTLVERKENLGLAHSIISGVTEVVNLHGSVIVLEDDIITSKYFLRYMNDALNLYQNNDQVISIGACNVISLTEETPETFFAPIPDCLGWATWKHQWDLFEKDGSKLLNELKAKKLLPAFNLWGAYRFEDMLKAQIKGRVSSWAVKWQATAYLHGKMTLYPKLSLTNHEHDFEGGTHATHSNYSKLIKFAGRRISVEKIDVQLLPEVKKQMLINYRKLYIKGSIFRQLYKILKLEILTISDKFSTLRFAQY